MLQPQWHLLLILRHRRIVQWMRKTIRALRGRARG
jgi:hypothetical protein